MTSKFPDFHFAFINVLWKVKRECMGGLFCIENLLELGIKKPFFKKLWILQIPKIPINIRTKKCFYRSDIETHKNPKCKDKIELKFAI